MDTNSARDVKLALLGDSGVGKSSLVSRFVTNTFEKYSESTIGASFMSKLIVVDGTPIKFQIWDTAGQEKYHSLAPMYYRGAAAAIVAYDITRRSSFETLKLWVNELRELGPEHIVIAVCGNKTDLEDKREVPTAEARAYATEIKALFIETSARSNKNVLQVFEDIARKLPADTGGGGTHSDLADLRSDYPTKRGLPKRAAPAAGAGSASDGGGTGCNCS